MDNVLKPLVGDDCLFNTVVKQFPFGTNTTCFSKRIFNPCHFEKQSPKIRPIEFTDYEYEDNHSYNDEGLRFDSLKRAREKAYEIAFANDFKYFVTLTSSRKLIERYDINVIYPKLKNFLSRKLQ